MTTETERRTRLSNAYAAIEGDIGERRRRRVAAAFRPDPRSEALMAIKTSDPARFAALPPSMRMQVGFYESALAAHEAIEKESGRG